MRRYRALLALALASLLLMVQTGTAVASVIQASAGSAMAPCPGCEEDETPQKPLKGDAVQCLAHCANEATAATATQLVFPPASSERARTLQPARESASAVPWRAVPSHPPPKRILYQSFQI